MEGLSFFTSSIFDIILVFIAIVSVYIGIANSLKSDAIASNANKLARKALDISIFGFKEQISPNLEGNIYITPNGENSCCIKFSLKNCARGPAIIKQINVKGRKKNIEIEEDIQYPATLLYNSGASIFSA